MMNPNPQPPMDLIRSVEAHLDELIRMQRAKVFALGRRLVPHLTPEDVLNPQDFPALARDWDFQFEDGILAGLIQAQISLRAAVFRPLQPPHPE